jgi:hypothetical protein
MKPIEDDNGLPYITAPWWYKFRLFTLHRKNVDVAEAQIKTLDSISVVITNHDLTTEQIKQLLENMIDVYTDLLDKI